VVVIGASRAIRHCHSSAASAAPGGRWRRLGMPWLWPLRSLMVKTVLTAFNMSPRRCRLYIIPFVLIALALGHLNTYTAVGVDSAAQPTLRKGCHTLRTDA